MTTEQLITCQHCGTENRASLFYCEKCKHNLHMAEQKSSITPVIEPSRDPGLIRRRRVIVGLYLIGFVALVSMCVAISLVRQPPVANAPLPQRVSFVGMKTLEGVVSVAVKSAGAAVAGMVAPFVLLADPPGIVSWAIRTIGPTDASTVDSDSAFANAARMTYIGVETISKLVGFALGLVAIPFAISDRFARRRARKEHQSPPQ